MSIEQWKKYSLAFQLTSVNADVHRAVRQRSLGNSGSAQRRLETALELLDLTITAQRGLNRRRELARLRELVADQLTTNPQHTQGLKQISALLEPFGVLVARERGVV